jgi:hypothetical protein
MARPTIGRRRRSTSPSTNVYGHPPLSKDSQHLDAAYVARAEKDVAQQLSHAGVRLAAVLNRRPALIVGEAVGH